MQALPTPLAGRALAAKLTDRGERRVVNQLAQQIARRQYVATVGQLLRQLEAAKRHGADEALLEAWQAELQTSRPDRADART